MATWYVDSSATGTHNGTSWANAWTALSQIAGVAAGDVVYISGGATGASQNYSVPSAGWTPAGGTAASPITYRIGQDAAHNGTAVFVHANAFLINCDNVVVSGDAGDGLRHFKLQSGGGNFAFLLTGHSGVRVSYIDGGSSSSRTWWYGFSNGTANMEIDHCFYHKLTEVNDDAIIYLSTDSRPANDTKIHDNVFHCPRRAGVKPDGFGDDFCSGKNWSGVNFYNNTLIGYSVGSNYLAGQHQDGSQPLGGDHIKWYNNYVQDISNYPFYGDAYWGGFSNLYVFNNIIAIVDNELRTEDSPQGMSISSEIPNSNSNLSNAPFSNVVASNNLIVDYGAHPATSVGDGGAGVISYGSNVGIWNNLATNNTNSPVFSNQGNSHVTNLNNVSLNPVPTGTGIFVNYTLNRADISDFHLVSADTSLIGKGTNLSSNATNCPEIMFDRDGVARPASGNWDIGPYQFSGTPPPPTVPNVIGMTQSAASSAITAAGFVVGTVSSGYSISVVAGQVYLQSPAAGATAAQGSAVNFTVSLGPPQVTVPNVVGMTQSNAGATIAGANLTVGTTTQQSSSTVPSGSVISQNPAAGASVNSGSAVALVISSGPAPTSTNFLIAPTSGTFTSGSNVWSFGAPNGSNYTTLLNGSPAGTGSGVILINENGVIEVQTYVKNWYKWNGSTWVSIPGPTPYP